MVTKRMLSGERDRHEPGSAENLIHLIPIVLVACVMILWFFSSSPQVGLSSDGRLSMLTEVGVGGGDEDLPVYDGLPVAGLMMMSSERDDGRVLLSLSSPVE